MSSQHEIVIKREELYERVWQTPATLLAAEYKMSDSRLGIICRKLKVPKPSPGYWMKIKHGKKARRPPLPSLGPDGLTEFVHIVDYYSPRPRTIEPEIQELLDKVPSIVVQQKLINPNPLIRNAWLLTYRGPCMYSESDRLPHIFLNVYPESRARALLLMDALVKGLKKLGYEVRGEDASNGDQYFEILGQRIRFKLFEKTKQVEHVFTPEETARKKRGQLTFAHKYDYLPTGRFELYLDPAIWGAPGYKKKWSDSTKKPLEDQLRDIIQGAILIASALKKEGESRERAERVRDEQRLKEAQEAKRIAEEEARRRALDNHVANWVKSKQLRAFINDFEKRLMSRRYSEQAKQEFRSWIRWASEYANQLDPITLILAGLASSPQKDK